MFGTNILKQRIRILELDREYNAKRIRSLEDNYYGLLKQITSLEKYLGTEYIEGPSYIHVNKKGTE